MNVLAWLLIGALLGIALGWVLDFRELRTLLAEAALGVGGALLGGWLGWRAADDPALLNLRAFAGATIGASLLLAWTHWRRMIRPGPD